MIVGKRGENIIDTIKRHISESVEAKKEWESMKEQAVKNEKGTDADTYEILIHIWDNTIIRLKQELSKYDE